MNNFLDMTRDYRPNRIMVIILIVTVLLASCSSNTPSPAESVEPAAAVTTESPSQDPGGPLVVFEWSGYELPEFWKPFADKYPDVDVEFSFYAEDAEALAKLQTGFDVDLIHPCNSWIGQLVENGLIQPIDTSRLSNWKGIIPGIAAQGQYQGKQYMVPWDWGYESILVRTDKVSEVPDSWADLWDPQYAGHVTVFDSGESNWMVAALTLGLDPYDTTPEEQAAIRQKLIELKPNLLNYWSDFTEVNQLVAAGDVWLAGHAWPDALVAMRDQGVEVEYITPKEGRLGYVCGFALSSDSKNPDLAYEYMNAAIDPQSMANLSNTYGYGAANADALPMTDPALIDLLDLDNPDIVNNTFFYRPLTGAQRELFTNTWSEVKAAP